jgi:zinc transport system substrate-binding protein
LVSCRKADAAFDESKITVITTIFAPYDFTREIARDNINLKMLLSPGAESHSFEASPRDIIEIQNSDIFIYTGGESDAWIQNILDSINTSDKDRIKMIALTDCVSEVSELYEKEYDCDNENEHRDYGNYDEHVWTSPANAKLIVERISDALRKADPENAEIYKNRTNQYLEKLDATDKEFQEIVRHAKREVFIFADRFPFRYFAARYGLEYHAAFPGCSPDSEASAATVRFLIDKVNSENIPVIFHIELSNRKIAETIAAETNAEILQFHSAHNISKTDFENGVTYLDIMRENAKNLRQALD